MTLPLIGAIEAGGTKFVLAVARADGTILERSRLPTRNPGATMPQVVDFFRAAAGRHGPLAAIGIGSFGPLDIDPASPAYGTIGRTPKPGWSGASYRAWLAPLGLPMTIDTDVNAAALGEWLAGAGQGADTLAYTTVGTGIGTGVVHWGRPLGGFGHYEAGHVRVPRDRTRDPFPGLCPYHGDCVEGLASGPAIAARFGASLDRLDDPSAAIALVGGYLADLAASLVLLHMPDRLVFGGGVMKAPGLLAVLRAETERRLGGYLVHPRLDPGLERYIVGPGLGDLAGIAGAIELGRQAAAQAAGSSG